jgi:hypothetical protein
MSNKVPQGRLAIERSIDADTYAELSSLKPSYVFRNFADMRDDFYLEMIARRMGQSKTVIIEKPDPEIEVISFTTPSL